MSSKHPIPPAAGKGTGKGHQAKAAAYSQTNTKFAKTFAKPTILDRQEYEQQAQRDAAGKSGHYGYPGYQLGHWTRPDKGDEAMKIHQQLVKASGPNGVGAFGQIMMPSEVPDYLVRKKQQEEQMGLWRLASQVIDKDRPETQNDAFELVPELRDYPETYHTHQLAMCEALRTLLRDGKMHGPEDLKLVAYILRDDTSLPMFPAWDPEGLIVNSALDASDFLNLNPVYAKRGLFSPKYWGVDPEKVAQMQNIEIQRKVKRMLCRRLFNNMREKTDTELDRYLKMHSAVYASSNAGEQIPVDNDVFGLATWAGAIPDSTGTAALGA